MKNNKICLFHRSVLNQALYGRQSRGKVNLGAVSDGRRTYVIGCDGSDELNRM